MNTSGVATAPVPSGASVGAPRAAVGGWRLALGYGALGLPLAFVALPLYVVLPNHYAREFGVPLAALGAVLLAVRVFDAFIDPLLGRWVDRRFARGTAPVLQLAALAAVLLALGFVAVFFPPVQGTQALLLWVSGALAVTYAAYSAISVAHQAWGAALGGDEAQRARVVGWREGFGLAGVLLASALPVVFDFTVSAAVFIAALVIGMALWPQAPRPAPGPSEGQAASALWLPWQRAPFRRLLLVFMLNGVASAVPATLVLFFVQDLLQAPKAAEGMFLGIYFLCAALLIPLWLKLVSRIGLARAWLCGMVLSVAVFAWAATLGPGDVWAFALVCALSGAALGADLALPGALLAGVIGDSGDRGRSDGAYFGWWNFATKLNLALAAGLALPLLALAGYTPGARDAQALQALVIAYCVLPCVLKLAAAAALHTLLIRRTA